MTAGDAHAARSKLAMFGESGAIKRLAEARGVSEREALRWFAAGMLLTPAEVAQINRADDVMALLLEMLTPAEVRTRAERVYENERLAVAGRLLLTPEEEYALGLRELVVRSFVDAIFDREEQDDGSD